MLPVIFGGRVTFFFLNSKKISSLSTELWGSRCVLNEKNVCSFRKK